MKDSDGFLNYRGVHLSHHTNYPSCSLFRKTPGLDRVLWPSRQFSLRIATCQALWCELLFYNLEHRGLDG